jgi:excisionase family DNA binding protein
VHKETGASDMLTIRQLSRYLQITLSTLYKLVEAGRLPGKKVGRQWRFRREVIDDWLNEAQLPREGRAAGVVRRIGSRTLARPRPKAR